MKLTKKEKAILKSLRKKWKWMARDKNKKLWAYNKKPVKFSTAWNFYDDFEFVDLTGLFKDKVFSFIRWEDEEPTNVDELLGNCEVQRDEKNM